MINLKMIVGYARFLLRSKKDVAIEDFLDASDDLYNHPVFKAWEQKAVAAAQALNWTVAVSPAGRAETVSPPPYAAPARESPTDFNVHGGK